MLSVCRFATKLGLEVGIHNRAVQVSLLQQIDHNFYHTFYIANHESDQTLSQYDCVDDGEPVLVTILKGICANSMAEALAVLSLASAIGQLIDLSCKVSARIKEFSSAVQDAPATYQVILVQLPLFQDVLRRLQSQCSSSLISQETSNALTPVIQRSLCALRKIESLLSRAIGTQPASDLRRHWQAMRSLLYDSKLQACLNELDSCIKLLLFHQSTTTVDTTASIQEALSNLTVKPSIPSASCYMVGWNVGNAPQIDSSLFVGRLKELNNLGQWLGDLSKTQRVVSIVGAGGLGKTQLSLAFAESQRDNYDAVLWLNAKDEVTLKQSFRDAWDAIASNCSCGGHSTTPHEDDLVVQKVRSWLSERKNTRWLLLLDNYDNPNLGRLSDGYDIRKYFPFRSQGAILITTRSHRLVFSRRMKLERLVDPADGIALLATRSDRSLTTCHEAATALVNRLGGLPLALATAGDYLRQTCASLESYLRAYEEQWNQLKDCASELEEYSERTLFTTWNLSLDQVKTRHPEIAEFLKLFAYFGNEDLWYDLFNVEIEDDLPWLSNIIANEICFNRAMGILNDYCLVETSGETYSLHSCVHDWIANELNPDPDQKMFRVALKCIADNVHSRHEVGAFEYNQRLLHHAQRLQLPQFRGILPTHPRDNFLAKDLYQLGKLWQSQGKLAEAEDCYAHAMGWTSSMSGLRPVLGFDTHNQLVASLCELYKSQGKLGKAEALYRTLYCDAHGRQPMTAMQAASEIALIKLDCGQTEQADELFNEVWRGLQQYQVPLTADACRTVMNLGIMCQKRGSFEWALFFYNSVSDFWKSSDALADIIESLSLEYNIALCKHQQGHTAEAEQLYRACLQLQEQVLPEDCPMTLSTVSALGILLREQRRYDEAEVMLRRATWGYQIWLTSGHPLLIKSAIDLAMLYRLSGRLLMAESCIRDGLKMWAHETGRQAVELRLIANAELEAIQTVGNDRQA